MRVFPVIKHPLNGDQTSAICRIGFRFKFSFTVIHLLRVMLRPCNNENGYAE